MLVLKLTMRSSLQQQRAARDLVFIGCCAAVFLLQVFDASRTTGGLQIMNLIGAVVWALIGIHHTLQTDPTRGFPLPEMTLEDARGLRDALTKAIEEMSGIVEENNQHAA